MISPASQIAMGFVTANPCYALDRAGLGHAPRFGTGPVGDGGGALAPRGCRIRFRDVLRAKSAEAGPGRGLDGALAGYRIETGRPSRHALTPRSTRCDPLSKTVSTSTR